MKAYQYQVLRYLPDLVTGEFINVGLVFLEPETPFLRAQVITTAERLNNFFPDAASQPLLPSLSYFADAINQQGAQLSNEQAPAGSTSKLAPITEALIQPNDAAWQLTPVAKGLTPDPAATFASLYSRLIRS
jgi:hypothetical protein